MTKRHSLFATCLGLSSSSAITPFLRRGRLLSGFSPVGGRSGMSRREVAQTLSIDEGTVEKWEKAKAQPAGRRLQKVEAFMAASQLSGPIEEK